MHLHFASSVREAFFFVCWIVWTCTWHATSFSRQFEMALPIYTLFSIIFLTFSRVAESSDRQSNSQNKICTFSLLTRLHVLPFKTRLPFFFFFFFVTGTWPASSGAPFYLAHCSRHAEISTVDECKREEEIARSQSFKGVVPGCPIKEGRVWSNGWSASKQDPVRARQARSQGC